MNANPAPARRSSRIDTVTLIVIAIGAYKVVRNFGRPIPGIVRATPNANMLIYLNYVNAMNRVQEKASAVIHTNDLSNLEQVTQSAMQAPVPDARAAELRLRVLDILSRLAAAAAKADMITLQMFSSVCAGQVTPEEAAVEAERRARRYFKT